MLVVDLVSIAVVVICYVSVYYVSLYSLAVYIDPDDVKTLYPSISERRRELLNKLANDPRAFMQIAIVYKSLVLIACSFLMIKLSDSMVGSLDIHSSRAILTPLSLAVVWLIYILAAEYLPRRSSRRAISPQMVKHLWIIGITYVLFSPVIKLYRDALRRSGQTTKVTEEEKEEIVERAIETLADEAGIGESIVEENEKEMIGQIFQLDQTVVKEIMIPRIDITAIGQSMSFRDIRTLVEKDGHSRYPVYGETIDTIVGLLFVKDLFNKMPEPGEIFDIQKYLREPYFVPENMVIGQLLTEFKSRRLHIAIVADEYGGVAGLVTLEDIIEEIFGEIQDEYDWEEEKITKLPDGRYLFDAGMMVEKMQDFFDTEFSQGNFDTVGGMIYDLVGSVPGEGQTIRWHDYEFEVAKVDGQRILRVKVQQVPSRNQ